MLQFVRRLSTVKVSDEVRHAIATNVPVVSLESTIITHGLPFPQNLDMAQRVEREIRNLGVIPATTAFINGVPRVGLSSEEIEQLASLNNALKVSRRDVPYVMARKLNGGTTISGTMILSARAGIKVFATGGLGGVHRDGQVTMDVSADLDELSRTSVAVVCAGPKSILDIERTMEYLETKGVFVGTLGPPGTNIPGFYTSDSGVKSVHNFQDFEEAARIIQQEEVMQLGTGQLFCIPPPNDIALDSDFINGVIEEASFDAKQKGIKGKELTPFLLSRIALATKGDSVKTNIEFVLNNAKSAAQISRHLSNLRYAVEPATKLAAQPSVPAYPSSHSKAQTLVIGSLALDTYCSMDKVILEDSNPVTITTSVGGVGYNVALESFKQGNDSLKFVSVIGDDIHGANLLESLEVPGHSVQISPMSTAQYISFHDATGSLVVAGADMGIIETLTPEFVEQEIKLSKSRVVLSDANVSKELINHVNTLSKELGFLYVVEPTSSAKAAKLAVKSLTPQSPLYLSTPTIAELCSMYDAFELGGKFDVEAWLPALDALGVDGSFRTRVDNAARKSPYYKSLVDRGVVQMATSLLPYMKHLIVKDGINGVLLFSSHDDIRNVPETSNVTLSLRSQGHSSRGILFEHYESPEPLHTVDNVTGAGDAFVGSLLNRLSLDGGCLNGEMRSVIVREGQLAAIAKIR